LNKRWYVASSDWAGMYFLDKLVETRSDRHKKDTEFKKKSRNRDVASG
jgi:hypothetical protein